MNKILFISNMEGSPWGGSEELWSQTALRLVKSGFNVITSTKAWTPLPTHIQNLQKEGCDVHLRKGDQSYRTRFLRKIFDYDPWAILNKIKPDMIVITEGSNFVNDRLAYACISLSIPYIIICQAASDTSWPNDQRALVISQLMESANAVYFVSQANIELTRKQTGSTISNGSVVRNPFKVSYKANPPWPDDDGYLHLASVGRLEPACKGQDILFEMLAQDKWRKRKIVVKLYGNGGNKLILEKLLKHYNLENVSFAGFTEDIESIWKENHALVLPSRMEGLPLAIVEAMLCGRPCIVTNVSGNAELIEDNITGFVADAPVSKCLDEAMERAWLNRNNLQTMGIEASKMVRQQIPPDPVGDFTKTLLGFLN